MNELQKRELDILVQFIDVCEKLNLTYYLVCGSALGAVKYGGFIPWDDDIDVALPREDYETFISNATALLPEHLFLQNYHTDSAFPKIFTKLRDSRTTYIEKGYQQLNINHGVFIDIFPLDGYPVGEREKREFFRKQRSFLRKTSCALDTSESLKSRALRFVLRMFGCHLRTNRELLRYEMMLRNCDDSNLYCNYGNFRTVVEITPKTVYGHGKIVTFEGLKVRIPEEYNVYLTQKYGDWRAELLEEEKKGHHYYEICDLNRSYTEYIANKKGGKIEIHK